MELLEYATTHRRDLVPKPTVLHGGSGIVLGSNTTEEDWAAHLDAALGNPYVLQRRIRPVTELFPDEGGRLQPWRTVWGVFTMERGFAGVLARGTRLETSTGVVNIANGAHGGTALYELAPTGIGG
ncbi:hypothetical protein ACH4VS_40270 [Streptomyces hygroscopicus]|uniref:hypothetical protein n=1 Tax=Streptomyces hygroscopicus TaxID=1912 RepID=UPI00082C53BD|nr:hypothetical protein [Streptomyces hygroscopicus]GLV80153.1 hypothetical protein Shyhy02_81530 [Streptomyces hygroscopicus subsp. hygroscopicus]